MDFVNSPLVLLIPIAILVIGSFYIRKRAKQDKKDNENVETSKMTITRKCLTVTCKPCGEVFVVGDDSTMITHETPDFSKGGRESLTSGKMGFLFDSTEPDAIGKTTRELFENSDKDMKRLWLLTLNLVIRDLEKGSIRSWYCGKCGVKQEYNNWTVGDVDIPNIIESKKPTIGADGKVACKKCGARVLPATAEKNLWFMHAML